MSDELPQEIQTCLHDLETHYCDFQKVERGGSAYLWFARNLISRAEVAIKFYAGESGERRHEEPKLLCQIRSPNILPIHDARNVSEDWAYFITPRCQAGDLDDLIASQPSAHKCIDIALGVCHGVSAIHAQGMVHRDLKPANIVMDGVVPRIADFGTVRALDPDSSVTTASQHSCLYRPPESWGFNTYTRAGDVYQLGLVTYQLLGGKLYYDGRNYLTSAERKTYNAIQDQIDQCLFVDAVIRRKAETGTLTDFASLPPWVTSSSKRTLRRMLHPNPAERLASMADVAAALHHVRKSTPDWSFCGTFAKLITGTKIFELRLIGSGIYEAFQQQHKNTSFRRVPGVKPGTLAQLIKICSS